ncbi:MAG TPA: hypothetical protein VLR94_02075 [Acidobacteriota bacterium]|nr:hypothetical protein [Acidobacteriota bacterium]
MLAVRICSLLVLLLSAGLAVAQEQSTAVAEDPASLTKPAVRKLELQDLEGLAIGALRQQFPRPSGIMATTSSCRLPDYGPMVSISLQLPPIYFTGPVLKELEKRSHQAEVQASRLREQLDHAAQIVRMKAREAELLAQIDIKQNKKKSKATVNALQTELDGVRKNISDLENGNGPALPVVDTTPPEIEGGELDLEKMMMENYQQAIRKIGAAMQDVLVESAVDLEDLEPTERICIATYIRDNFVSGQERSILFILNPEAIDAYRSGKIDRKALREKVLVKDEVRN